MKNILLTGCSKGVGLEVTKCLINHGFKVYGISRSVTKGIQDLMEEHPNQIAHLKYDLENINDIKDFIFKNFLTNQVKLHAFINNAAIAYDDIITNLDPIQLQKMFNVNVFTPFLLTKYAIRNMLLHRNSGVIIHLSSICVHTGYKGLSMYASTKGALEAFSKNVSREWGGKGIRSNCIVAGFMETDMSSTLDESQKTRIYNRNSLKEPVKIISVANTVLFLISDDSSSITGQNIFVDNGTI